jgi:hypothetical protein
MKLQPSESLALVGDRSLMTFVPLWRTIDGLLDFVTSVSLLRLGWQGVLYAPAFEPWTAEEDDFWAGWQVWISRLVPCGSIYVETVASAEPLVEAPPEDRLISIWTLGE